MIDWAALERTADVPGDIRRRIELIVAMGRLVFAAFTFMVLPLDPFGSPTNVALVHPLLIGYLVYAAAFAAFALWRTPGERTGLITHVVDLVLFPVFMYLTARASNPFFVYFIFVLVVATMRWQWRGVLWTAVFAIAAANLLSVYAASVRPDRPFNPERFLNRNFFLVGTATLLGYLGFFERLLRAELARRTRKAAAAEERVRLARDLHDGLLQTLTGAALQLQTAERLVDRDPGSARAVLGTVQGIIAEEQRDLRFFVSDLKPGQIGALDEGGGLEPALRHLARRLESVWGVALYLPASLPPMAGSDALLGEVYRVVQEAAVNAAKHGKATRVTLQVSQADGRLAIIVADNGTGFPFQGRLDHGALAASHRGPRILRERVEALGGTLVIDSSKAGSRLEIAVPITHGA